MHVDLHAIPHQGDPRLRGRCGHPQRQRGAGQEMSMMRNQNQIAARRIVRRLAACAAFCIPLIGSVSLAQESAPTEPQAAGAPPEVRRLTESQYRATVADIFGPDIPIVGRFEHGLRAEGLLAVGTSQAGISAFSFEQYDASARGVAAEVVSEKRREQLVPCRPRSEKQFRCRLCEAIRGALRADLVPATLKRRRGEALRSNGRGCAAASGKFLPRTAVCAGRHDGLARFSGAHRAGRP